MNRQNVTTSTYRLTNVTAAMDMPTNRALLRSYNLRNRLVIIIILMTYNLRNQLVIIIFLMIIFVVVVIVGVVIVVDVS